MSTTKTSVDAQSTLKVGYEALNSANVRISNKGDENRSLGVSANVNIYNGNIQSIDSGMVTEKDDTARTLANFSKYGDNSLTISFQCGDDRQGEILNEVQGFIADTKTLITEKPMSANF